MYSAGQGVVYSAQSAEVYKLLMAHKKAQPDTKITKKRRTKADGAKSSETRQTRALREVQTRATVNRQIRRESLREELQAREYLRQLMHIDAELGGINDSVKKLVVPKVESPLMLAKAREDADFELHKAGTRIKALRVRADINFRRLAKVLPDLKAVALTDGEGNNPFAKLIDEVRKLTEEEQLGE